MPTNALVFAIAFITVLILTPIVRALCVRFSLHADPNPIIATHKVPTPTLGGVSIFIALMLALAVSIIPTSRIYFLKIFIGILPIFLMGIYDDLKGLSFKFKGLMEIILVLFFIFFLDLKPGFAVFKPFDYFLMILWFVGVINAFNLIDIMDGMASGIALFASLGFMVLASLTGHPDLVPICIVLAACYLAFLYFNFNPARIFLGDNGSLVMGLALAYVGFKLVGQEHLSFRAVAPVIILAIPIFEVHLLIFRRLKKKISVFKGSPDHLGLILQALGNSIQVSAWIVYFAALVLALLGIWVGTTSLLSVQIAVSLVVLIIGILLLRWMVKIKVPEKESAKEN